MAEPVGDPYVAPAVDVQTAVDDCGLEIVGFARIRGREARYLVAGVRDPDPILLIDGEMKWPEERLARLCAVAFADDSAPGPVTLGNVHELALRDAESPHVAVRRGDDALHQPELAIEGDTLRRCQRLAVLVEHRNRLAPISRKPGVVLGVDRRAERVTLHAAPGKPGGDRRQRFAVRIELGGIALPQRILPLPANGEVVADPKVAFAVEHRLSTRAITAAIELERQHPRAWGIVEIRYERHRPEILALGNWIKLFQQHKQPLGPVPGIAGDRL